MYILYAVDANYQTIHVSVFLLEPNPDVFFIFFY